MHDSMQFNTPSLCRSRVSTYMCLVGVTLFSVNATILDDVLECLVRQPSLAAMVTFSSCVYN